MVLAARCRDSKYMRSTRRRDEKGQPKLGAVPGDELVMAYSYRRLVPLLGHNKTIGAIAHRICQLIWMILYKGVRYEERGPSVSEQSKRVRTVRMIRTLRKLGYRVELQADPT